MKNNINQKWIETIEYCKQVLDDPMASSTSVMDYAATIKSLNSLKKYLENEREMPELIADALVPKAVDKDKFQIALEIIKEEIDVQKAMA